MYNLTVVPGELQSVDGYMNIALEKTEEYVNGVKRRAYGDAFVRGNNGEFPPTPTKHDKISCCGPRSLTYSPVMYISGA